MYSAKQPSRWTPMHLVLGHTCRLPSWQIWQWLQGMWDSADTRSPTFTVWTSLPVSTTSPENSWPMTTGGCIRAWAQAFQWRMWTSVPQTAAAFTRTRMSRGPIWGMGRVRSSILPGAAAVFTTARMVPVMAVSSCSAKFLPAPYQKKRPRTREFPFKLVNKCGKVGDKWTGQRLYAAAR